MSATCLLGDLAPFARAELVEEGSNGCELLIADIAGGDVRPVLNVISEWLRTCNLESTRVQMGGATYTLSA